MSKKGKRLAKYEMRLYTYENGTAVKKDMVVSKYYSLWASQGRNKECNNFVACATLSDLYRMWREAKADDETSEDGIKWRYSFFRHLITVEKDRETGKKQYVDTRTRGRIYRRKNRVYFKAV